MTVTGMWQFGQKKRKIYNGFEISNFRPITLFKPHENIRKSLFLMFLRATEREH